MREMHTRLLLEVWGCHLKNSCKGFTSYSIWEKCAQVIHTFGVVTLGIPINVLLFFFMRQVHTSCTWVWCCATLSKCRILLHVLLVFFIYFYTWWRDIDHIFGHAFRMRICLPGHILQLIVSHTFLVVFKLMANYVLGQRCILIVLEGICLNGV